MLSVLALALLAALYVSLRAVEVLAGRRPPGAAGTVAVVLAVLLLLTAVATLWAVWQDAVTLRQVADTFRGLFGPPRAN